MDDIAWPEYSDPGGGWMNHLPFRLEHHIRGRAVVLSLLWVLLAGLLFPKTQPAQQPFKTDSFAPYLPSFSAFNPRLEQFEFQGKERIDEAHSAVVIRATSSGATIDEFRGNIHQLLMQEAFGIFIVRNDDSSLVLAVDVMPSGRFLDYEVQIVGAGRQHLIISKGGGIYGMDAGRTKYFYDLESRKLLGKASYYGMSISSIIEFEGDLYFIGSGDRETTVITRLKPDPVNPIRDYQIIDSIGGRPVPHIDTATVDGNALVLKNETHKYSLSGGKWSVAANSNPAEYRWNPPTGAVADLPDVNFWVPLFMVRRNLVELEAGGNSVRKLLVWNSDISSNSHGLGAVPGIYEIMGKERRLYPLSQATEASFLKHRPGWVRKQRGQVPHQYDQNVGPFQLVGGLLWFGITFYDGEGLSGIGGVGYFDAQTNQFHLEHYPEITDWSASAILVEEGCIWLGAIRRPEGSVVAGGLVRIIRKEGNVSKYEVPAVINRIIRSNSLVYLGTDEGIFILKDGKLAHLQYDIDLNGKYSVATKWSAAKMQPKELRH